MIWRESGGMGKCSKALTNCKNTGNAEARNENTAVSLERLCVGSRACEVTSFLSVL